MRRELFALRELARISAEIHRQIEEASAVDCHPLDRITDLLSEAKSFTDELHYQHYALEVRPADGPQSNAVCQWIEVYAPETLLPFLAPDSLETPDSSSGDCAAALAATFEAADLEGWRSCLEVLLRWQHACEEQFVGSQAQADSHPVQQVEEPFLDEPHHQALIAFLRSFNDSPHRELVWEARGRLLPHAESLRYCEAAAQADGLTTREYIARETLIELRRFLRRQMIEIPPPPDPPGDGKPGSDTPLHDGPTDEGIRLDGTEYKFGPRVRKLVQRIWHAEGRRLTILDASDDRNKEMTPVAAQHIRKEFNKAVSGSGWCMSLKQEVFHVYRIRESSKNSQ